MDHLEPCYYSNRLIEKLKLLDTRNQLDFTLINKAIYWAKKYHNGQFRKSGEPFYTHPLETAYMVSDYNLKTDIVVASILHDIIEDTEVTAEMILNAFGSRIEEMVDRLTRDRLDGTKLGVEEILNNAYRKNDKEVLLIKIIDRLHNMKTIGVKTPEKIKKIADETFNLFIIIAIHTKHQNLEKLIYNLCCKALSIEVLPCKFSQITKGDSYLDYLKNTDTHQIVSQVFQSVTAQIKS